MYVKHLIIEFDDILQGEDWKKETPFDYTHAMHTLFLDDLLSRSLTPDKQTGGLVNRTGRSWMVFDTDGTLVSRACFFWLC